MLGHCCQRGYHFSSELKSDLLRGTISRTNITESPTNELLNLASIGLTVCQLRASKDGY